jgi:cbb3-type cytochrome oxidase maturation protein
MNILVILVPCSLILGLGALWAFVWTLRHDQYSDPAGDAERILLEDDVPLDEQREADRPAK